MTMTTTRQLYYLYKELNNSLSGGDFQCFPKRYFLALSYFSVCSGVMG
jgi:hypothetical protein